MTAPVPPVHLDQLEGRLRNAAMGSLRVGEHYGIHLYAGESPVGMTLRAADAAAIVAAVNAATDLIAELRATRAERDTLRAKQDAVQALLDPEAGMATGNGYDGTRLFDERAIRNALDGGS